MSEEDVKCPFCRSKIKDNNIIEDVKAIQGLYERLFQCVYNSAKISLEYAEKWDISRSARMGEHVKDL